MRARLMSIHCSFTVSLPLISLSLSLSLPLSLCFSLLLRAHVFEEKQDVVVMQMMHLFDPKSLFLANFTRYISFVQCSYSVTQASVNTRNEKEKSFTTARVAFLKKVYRTCEHYQQICDELNVNPATASQPSTLMSTKGQVGRRESIDPSRVLLGGSIGPSACIKLKILTRQVWTAE